MRPARRKAARRRGFTMVEIMVVVVIIGILASLASIQYTKSVENSHAQLAAAVLREVGSANRMRLADGKSFVGGQITTACTSDTCGGDQACDLVSCRMVSDRNWADLPYEIYACDNTAGPGACCAIGLIGCAKRKSGAYPGTTVSPYKDWYYTMNASGVVANLNGAPSP